MEEFQRNLERVLQSLNISGTHLAASSTSSHTASPRSSDNGDPKEALYRTAQSCNGDIQLPAVEVRLPGLLTNEDLLRRLLTCAEEGLAPIVDEVRALLPPYMHFSYNPRYPGIHGRDLYYILRYLKGSWLNSREDKFVNEGPWPGGAKANQEEHRLLCAIKKVLFGDSAELSRARANQSETLFAGFIGAVGHLLDDRNALVHRGFETSVDGDRVEDVIELLKTVLTPGPYGTLSQVHRDILEHQRANVTAFEGLWQALNDVRATAPAVPALTVASSNRALDHRVQELEAQLEEEKERAAERETELQEREEELQSLRQEVEALRRKLQQGGGRVGVSALEEEDVEGEGDEEEEEEEEARSGGGAGPASSYAGAYSGSKAPNGSASYRPRVPPPPFGGPRRKPSFSFYAELNFDLFKAAQRGSVRGVLSALNRGARAWRFKGDTPLVAALARTPPLAPQFVEVACILLGRNAFLSADLLGGTSKVGGPGARKYPPALHLALLHGPSALQVVERLLDLGARFDRQSFGEASLQKLAPEIKAVLRERGLLEDSDLRPPPPTPATLTLPSPPAAPNKSTRPPPPPPLPPASVPPSRPSVVVLKSAEGAPSRPFSAAGGPDRVRGHPGSRPPPPPAPAGLDGSEYGSSRGLNGRFGNARPHQPRVRPPKNTMGLKLWFPDDVSPSRSKDDGGGLHMLSPASSGVGSGLSPGSGRALLPVNAAFAEGAASAAEARRGMRATAASGIQLALPEGYGASQREGPELELLSDEEELLSWTK